MQKVRKPDRSVRSFEPTVTKHWAAAKVGAVWCRDLKTASMIAPCCNDSGVAPGCSAKERQASILDILRQQWFLSSRFQFHDSCGAAEAAIKVAFLCSLRFFVKMVKDDPCCVFWMFFLPTNFLGVAKTKVQPQAGTAPVC